VVRLPETPVIVTVVVPIGAVAFAAKVSVLLDATGFGVKEAVTPFGSPEAVRDTFELNPPVGVMVILLDPWLNWAIARLAGLSDSVKEGLPVPVMVRLIVVLCVKLPEVPVIVTVAVPVVAVALAVNVRVLVLVAGLGLNAAVIPLGKPDAERVMLPLKLFDGVIVIALVPLLPCATLNAVGNAESV
jgi:hypothetical protein